MGIKKLLVVSAIGAFVTGVAGCKKETLELEVVAETAPSERTINGHQYKFEGNRVTELTSDEDNQAVYGVLTDLHGEYETVRALVQKFQDKNVEGILVAGDLAQHFRNKQSDEEEIRKVLEELAKPGVPVYFIPGNHDIKKSMGKRWLIYLDFLISLTFPRLDG